MKRKFKNIISTLLIAIFIVSPILGLPKKVEAQSITGNYISGELVAALPGCAEEIYKGVKSLLFDDIPFVGPPAPALEKIVTDLIVDRIKVDTGALEKKVDSVIANTAATEAATETLALNDNCLKAIGKIMVKMLLQKITMSTVEWINNGFNGKPAWVQNPGRFLENIAKTELLSFGLEMNPPKLYPFARAFLATQVKAFQRKFKQNAQFSLDELINATNQDWTKESFYEDFSKGGWDAWTYMAQPHNNPIGFQIMASNELQKRLKDTFDAPATIIKDALKWSGGFLGQERCANPRDKNLTRAIDDEMKGFGVDMEGYKYYGDQKIQSGMIRCKRWETVTPGKMAAEAITKIAHYPDNAYLKADDLNSAIAAVADAIINRFATKWMNDGLADLDKAFGPKDKEGWPDYDKEILDDFKPRESRISQDFGSDSSAWLQANLKFNIRQDLTQALIDEQRTYSEKLTEQNEIIPELFRVIFQLDYCIPGPHPGWYNDSQTTLDNLLNTIPAETENSVASKETSSLMASAGTILATAAAIGVGLAIAGSATVLGSAVVLGMAAGSVLPIIGTIIGAVVGVAVAWIWSLFSSPDEPEPDSNLLKVQAYYAAQVAAMTGMIPDYAVSSRAVLINLQSKQGLVNVMNTILSRYAEIITETYTPDFMPEIANLAEVKFRQVPGYSQIFENNTTDIANTNGMIGRLEKIKESIEELNKKLLKDKTISTEVYEEDLKPIIRKFARISSGMVNGDNIANADNLSKQMIDEKKYIYNDLLKGPDGCEKQMEVIMKDINSLEISKENDLRKAIYNTQRKTYPANILYDYNLLPEEKDIPDPLDSGYKTNKMTSIDKTMGPGFLSALEYLIFWTGDERLDPITHPLNVADILAPNTSLGTKPTAIGRRADKNMSGTLEYTIAVY